MPRSLWCAQSIHLARVDDDIVVLDVAADRYSALLEAAETIRLDPDGRIVAAHDGLAEDLVRAGLAASTPPMPRRTPIVALREAEVAPHPSRSERLRAGAALVAATLAFRGKTFAALLDAPPPPPASTQAVAADRLAELIGAARRARPWIPFEGECLQRAYLMRAYLAKRRIATDWVFGVRTRPFAAHCWLQIGDRVVADRLERVRLYTPIMVA